MDLQLTIKVVILGEKNSGRTSFKRMLYPSFPIISNNTFAETYIETDTKLFPKITKEIAGRCHRGEKCVTKCPGVTDSQIKSHYINKNIFLSWCHIGNDYCKYTDEIYAANIIIYLTPRRVESELDDYIKDIIATSRTEKFVMTLITKQDTTARPSLHDIHISCKFAHAIRCMIYKCTQNIEPGCDRMLANCFGLDVRCLRDEICSDRQKYLTQCGFINFRDTLVSIIQNNYKAMLRDNFMHELLLCRTNFIDNIEILIGKVALLESVAGIVCKEDIDIMISEYVASISDGDYECLAGLECLRKFIPETKCCIQKKIARCKEEIVSTCVDNHHNIRDDIYLPSAIHVIMTTTRPRISIACDRNPGAPDLLACQQILGRPTLANCTYVCDLYSHRTFGMLTGDGDLQVLYDAFFNPKEIKCMVNILMCVQKIISPDIFRDYLFKIFVVKISLAIAIIEQNCERSDSMIMYCRSLSKFLKSNKCCRLSDRIINICDAIVIKYFDIHSELLDIFNDICDDIDASCPDEFDNFVVKSVLTLV